MNATHEVSIALVGIGGYGSWYLRELLPNAGQHHACFIAGIDAFPERSPWLGRVKDAGIPVFASLDDFYRNASADLVVLSTPIHLHAPQTIQALQHGSNVLCEKPLCARLAEADQMAQAERETGKFVGIGYQWSFSDATLALKRAVLAGRFGRPLRLKTLVLWPRPLSYYGRNTWAGRICTDAGDWVYDSPVSNATAHYLHNMLYLLGESLPTSARPEKVEAKLWRANDIENYDAAAVRVTLGGEIELLMLTAHPVANEVGPLAVYEFEDAVIEYGAERSFIVRFRDGHVENYGDPDETQYNKLWHAVDAVRTGAPLACGIEASRPHVEIVNRLQEMAVNTFPVKQIVYDARGEDTLVWVRGLQESFESAYANAVMPDLV
jgi:predicted dehydrogenase